MFVPSMSGGHVPDTGSSPFAREIVAGALAGVAEYTVCQPIDIVATRRMLSSGSAEGNIFTDMALLVGGFTRPTADQLS